ncbi:MAG: hypothetical protein H6978_05345 [Gammaproteobacteria bacterium]|nr:hypothetical protein [Gammaproteobacteria bacterium]
MIDMRALALALIFSVFAAAPLAAQDRSQIPQRGATMARVIESLGEPVERLAAVGDPPITRWRYNGFTVYFEYDRVLHTVVR